IAPWPFSLPGDFGRVHGASARLDSARSACDRDPVSLPERAELLALMDANMVAVYAADTRATPGGAVAETPGLVMCRTPHGTVATNLAILSRRTDEHFASLAGVTGPTTKAYLAYQDGHAVAGAILYMAHGVGGIGWVGTLPEEFGRGYGRAVTSAVIAAGLGRGARFMSLQASPMGEPMYRRMGFTTPTHYSWFLAAT